MRCSAQAIVSVNVFALVSSLPSRYHCRPSSPPPRGWASAHTKPRSSRRDAPPRTTAASTPRRRRTRRSRRVPFRRGACRRGARCRWAPSSRRPVAHIRADRYRSRIDVGCRHLLEQLPGAGRDVLVVQRRRHGGRLRPEPNAGRGPPGFDARSTSWGASPRSMIRSLPSRNRMRNRGCASTHSLMTRWVRERVGTDDPSSCDVRHESCPRPTVGPVAVGRCGQEPEVDGIVVGVHDQQVAPVVDAVLDAVLASPHDHRLAGRLGRWRSAASHCSSCSTTG